MQGAQTKVSTKSERHGQQGFSGCVGGQGDAAWSTTCAPTFDTVRGSKKPRITFHAMAKMLGALMTNVLYICSAAIVESKARRRELIPPPHGAQMFARTWVVGLIDPTDSTNIAQNSARDVGHGQPREIQNCHHLINRMRALHYGSAFRKPDTSGSQDGHVMTRSTHNT